MNLTIIPFAGISFNRIVFDFLIRSFQHLHNRSALLGDTNRTPSPALFDNNSRSSSPAGSMKEQKLNDNDLELLESQSDERITGLSAKVQTLKNVCYIVLSSPLPHV